jgi:glycosyltransferase involved in cell wall biosynthesis
MTLFVDHRWNGQFGIGRYSSEVLSRLSVPAEPLKARGKPLDLRGMFAATSLTSVHSVYSPGFNAGVTRARQVLTIHDLIHLKQPEGLGASKRLFYQRVLKPAVLRSGLVFTDSESSKRDIQEWLGNDRVRVVNAGCGISDSFVPEGEAVPLAAGEFIYVGNLKLHKNAEVILDALVLRPDYRVLWVTTFGGELLGEATKRGVERQISVKTGLSDPELAAHYRGSSGLLFPSILEGFGLPPLEALSSGAPVAFSQVCDVVAENVGAEGIAVSEAHSAEAWADAMDQLIGIPRDNLRSQVNELRGRFRWSDVAERVSSSLMEFS